MAKKKIAIVGAGAVGGYAGAHMVQAGEDVTYIDPWPENVEAIRNDGLRITHIRDVEPFTVRPRALHLTEAQQLSKEAPIDIAFVRMKSYDTAWATAMISVRSNWPMFSALMRKYACKGISTFTPGGT